MHEVTSETPASPYFVLKSYLVVKQGKNRKERGEREGSAELLCVAGLPVCVWNFLHTRKVITDTTDLSVLCSLNVREGRMT